MLNSATEGPPPDIHCDAAVARLQQRTSVPALRGFRHGAVVATVAAACVLGSAPAEGSAVTTLGGTNVISGSGAAYVDVRVPKTVWLSTPFGGGDQIAVSGGAALSAIVLVGRDAATRHVTLAGGGAFVAGYPERFLLPVRQWPLDGGTYETIKTYPDVTTLPAGTYRLYFVSSGRGTVTLSLRGLSGRRTVVPRIRARGSVRLGDELTRSPVRGNVFAANATATLSRRGFAMQVLQTRLERAASWQLVMCHNNPDDALATPLRDTPGCPNGEKHTIVNHRSPAVDPDTKLFVQAYATLPAGDHGLSAVFAAQALTTAIAYSTVWLEYQ